MNLKKYFHDAKGTGILATADQDGKVNMAIFSRPHVMEDGTVALIMRDRLTHKNLQSNPHAAYLFMKEDSDEYKGKRLFLTKIREEEESELLYQLKRKKHSKEEKNNKGSLFLVFFSVERELPLIGTEDKLNEYCEY